MDEIMTIKDVSEYLKMHERTVSKLAAQGILPAAKIANQWRFMRSVINKWLEQQMFGLTSEQLETLDSEVVSRTIEVTDFLRPDLIIPAAKAHKKTDLLAEMVDLAADKKLIRNPILMLKVLVRRETLCSTAIGDEVAIPHPRQPLNGSSATPFIVMARSFEGIDFDSIDELPVKLVFLVCISDDFTHLKVLARLSRMVRDDHFRELLKSAPESAEIFALIKKKDSELSLGKAK